MSKASYHVGHALDTERSRIVDAASPTSSTQNPVQHDRLRTARKPDTGVVPFAAAARTEFSFLDAGHREDTLPKLRAVRRFATVRFAKLTIVLVGSTCWHA